MGRSHELGSFMDGCGRRSEPEPDRAERPAAASQSRGGGWDGSRPWRGGCTAAAVAAAALLTAIGPAAAAPTGEGAGRGRPSPTVHVLQAGCANGAGPGDIAVLEWRGRWPGPRPALFGEGRSLRGGGEANATAATEILRSEADVKEELGTRLSSGARVRTRRLCASLRACGS